MDFLIGPNNDWTIENGDVVIVKNASYVRQLWLIRVRKFRGEWILDQDDGVPYVQELFEKNRERRIVEVFRELTLNTPGVIAVQYVSIDSFDVAAREISITVEAKIEGPEDLTFQYNGYLPTTSECPNDFPTHFEGINTWIDAQDLVNTTYDGSDTSVTNKAAAGQGDGNADVVPVSLINNHRAIDFENNEIITVEDTPAIRHGDGSLTMFLVFKNNTLVDGTYGLVTFRGINSGVYERYIVYLSVASSVVTLNISSKNNTGADTTVSAVLGGGLSPTIMSMTLDSLGTLSVEMNGSTLGMSASQIPLRLLDGDYVLGATDYDTAIANNLDGLIGELIVYEEELSTEDVNSVTVCLGRKWGIDVPAEELNVGFGYFPQAISAFGL